MKKILILLLAFGVLASCSGNEENLVPGGDNTEQPDDDNTSDDDNTGDINLTNPPLSDPEDVCSGMDDAFFVKFCLDYYDADKNGKVSKEEAAAATEMHIRGSEYDQIRSMKGIGYFTNLEVISCSSNTLAKVDLSANLKIVTIQSRAFRSCVSLTRFIFPDSVTKIESYAFQDCSSLIGITLPDGVTRVADGAFMGCTNLAFFSGKLASEDRRLLICEDPWENSRAVVAFAPAGLTEYTVPDGVSGINSYSFCDCKNLESITIPEGVRAIGLQTFANCTSLKHVNLPNSLTRIYSYAFINCTSLERILLPDGVTHTGDNVFKNCSALTEATLGKGVVDMGSPVFPSCDALTDLYCKASTPPTLGDYSHSAILDNNNKTCTIHVPTASVDQYKSTRGWSQYADRIVGHDF